MLLPMSVTAVPCHYCSAENVLQTVERTTHDKITLKLLEHEQSKKVVVVEKKVECRFCRRKYEIITFPNFLWLKSKLKPTNTMLETFKTKFANCSLELLYNNVFGITRPQIAIAERVRRHRHYHICFLLDGTRAYIDCQELNLNGTTILRGLDIYEA
jgi:hypothetical protein